MIINQTVSGIIAIISAYLLGSIPFAYVFTRLSRGIDVRRVGGGNVGARNAFVNVGKMAGIATGFFDIAKGFGGVAIAYYLMSAPGRSNITLSLFWVLAGLAVVAGHIWTVFLKFKGGNGLATTLGIMAFLIPWEILIAVGITLVLWILTRNLILAFNLSLLSTPVSGWLLTGLWVWVVFPLIVIVVITAHFSPVMLADIKRATSRQEFFGELLRRRKRGI